MGSDVGRVLRETVAWLLVVAGIAALVLPGPGLLMMCGGLALLARHYAWAGRWLGPVRRRALQGAAHSVATWPRIVLAAASALGIIGCGVVWTWSPAAPSWWPVSEAWWLPGGVAVAVTQFVAGMIGLGTIAYSCRRFRGRRDASSFRSCQQTAVEEAAA
ncbi:(CHP02611) superfamily protein [Nocardioidaceae bacterium Broad-1]|nr:(CHP02611) superfamily protein [Nocardioidaceae bacterium Broad-1]